MLSYSSKLAMQPKTPVDHGRVEPGIDASGFNSPPCLDDQVSHLWKLAKYVFCQGTKSPSTPSSVHLSNENIHHFKVAQVLWCPLHRRFVFSYLQATKRGPRFQPTSSTVLMRGLLESCISLNQIQVPSCLTNATCSKMWQGDRLHVADHVIMSSSIRKKMKK